MKTLEYLKSLKTKQREVVDFLSTNTIGQVCCTTGFGKGYVMFKDIIRRIDLDEKVIAIATHRLSLNTQHVLDLIKELYIYNKLHKVRFIHVGSDKIDFNEYGTGIGVNVRNTKSVNDEVDKFLSRGKHVVIVSTYHSLNYLSQIEIDTIYCDEAHTLASVEDQSMFEDNYKSIIAKNKYFLTATPKDILNDIGGTFTMNDESVFGKRFGYTYDELRKDGYVPQICWHIPYPEELNSSSNINFFSIKNQVKIILESFKKHTEILKLESAQPESIEPKLLIKANSVNEMWKLYNALIKLNLDIKICAGASSDGQGGKELYKFNGIEYKKDNYIETLSNLNDLEKAIVIHVDTLSEGINVPGFTAVMFLTKTTPTEFKILQNVGRAMRLCKIDRERWKKGEISADDSSKWVKPKIYVILPMLDIETTTRTKRIKDYLRMFRDNLINIHNIYVQCGNDFSMVSKDETDTIYPEFSSMRESINEVNNVVHDIEQQKIDNMTKNEHLQNIFNTDFSIF